MLMYSSSTAQQVLLCNPDSKGPAKTHHSRIIPRTRKPDNRWGDSQNSAQGRHPPRQTHQSDHVQLMLRNAFIACMLDSFHQKASCRRVHPQIAKAGDLQQEDTVRPAALLQLPSNALAFCKFETADQHCKRPRATVKHANVTDRRGVWCKLPSNAHNQSRVLATARMCNACMHSSLTIDYMVLQLQQPDTRVS